MAPRRVVDKGKPPMEETEGEDRLVSRSRSTEIIIRDALNAERRPRGWTRTLRVESEAQEMLGQEGRAESKPIGGEQSVPADEVPLRSQDGVPEPSSGAAPTAVPGIGLATEERMATMMDMMMGMMHSFQEFVQAQGQQRAAGSSVPPRRPPSPERYETPAPELERGEQRRRVQEDRVDMKAFQDMRPPTFQGEMDYRVADRWVTRLEKIFEYLQCTEEQRVRYATFMLEGEAEAWWRTERQTLPVGGRGLTWAEFLERFYHHYVPDSERSRRVAEFMTLIQGKQMVAEYDAQFRSLMRFVPWAQANPREAARKFQEGLKLSIRRGVAPFKLNDYGEILDRALVVEREEEEYCKIKEKRKSGKANGQGRRQKPRTGQVEAPTGRGGCFQCGQFGHRKADCPQLQGQAQGQAQGQPQRQGQWQNPRGQNTCYQCGQLGHWRSECPQLHRAVIPRVQQQPFSRAPFGGRGRGRGGGQGQYMQTQSPQGEQRPQTAARVQAVTGQEAQAADGVVTGNLMVCGYLAHVLFDPGATHSFIALSFVQKVGLTRSPMYSPMSVSTPLRAVHVAEEICRSCYVVIEGRQFHANLIVLDMKDLDVILGMDWLSKWNAIVHCKAKKSH